MENVLSLYESQFFSIRTDAAEALQRRGNQSSTTTNTSSAEPPTRFAPWNG
jgi:hypothetical protein